MIQAQMSKIALTSAQIYAALQRTDQLAWPDTTKFTEMLDSWYHELPTSLHLAALVSPDNQLSLAQTRSLMLVHVIYLGTRLHLHQHLLKLIESRSQHSARVSGQLEPSVTFQVPQVVRHEYTGFAQQQARIISLLYQNKAVFTRCWLVMYVLWLYPIFPPPMLTDTTAGQLILPALCYFSAYVKRWSLVKLMIGVLIFQSPRISGMFRVA